MADDVTLPAPGAIIAADEVGGKKYQRVKISHGADGAATDTSEEAPFPVGAAEGAFADGSIVALGSLADPAWDGTTPTTPGLLSAIKGVFGQLALWLSRFGTVSDTAWSGSGDPTSYMSMIRAMVAKVLADAPTAVSPISSEYELVAASQTDQIMGTTGAIGDTIDGILVIPTTTAVGAISIEDGGTNTPVYAGGTVGADLKPFFIPLFGIKATTATGWEITSGGNESLIVFGQFT